MQAPPHPSTRRLWLAPAVFAALAAALVALLWTAPSLALDVAERAVAWLRDHDDGGGRAIATTVLAATVALAFIAAWARATAPGRPVALAGGRGRVGVSELGSHVREALLEQPHVADAAVRVENRGRRGVAVAVLLHVTPDARLEQAVEATTHCVRETLADRAGVPLAAPPAVELRYRELVLRTPRAKQSRDSHAA